MLILLIAMAVQACGDGSGDSSFTASRPPGVDPGSGGPGSTGVLDFEINEQTYVALAASLYTGATALDALLNAQAAIMLSSVLLALEPSSAQPCDISGETVFEVMKSTYGAFVPANTGDSISIINNACVDSTGDLREGTDSLFVRMQAAEDALGASQYELSGDSMTTQANGEVSFARSHLELVHADLASPRGELKFTGINNSVLEDTRAPNEDSLLSGIAPESLAVFQGSAVNFYETSAGRFDTFATETAILDINGNSRIERQFEFDVNGAADASYTLTTTSPFVTMEIEGAPDPEFPDDDPDTSLVAQGGGFVINMDAGERIEVSVIGDSSFDSVVGPLDANVQVSFDREGDGTIDARQMLSFEEFNASLFSLFAAR